jgi:nucleoside 2-deoxyribosyltransferase
MKTVYLAGSINGKSDDECKRWRDAAQSSLESAALSVLNPLRRDYRGLEDDSVDEIVTQDLFDISSSDVLLVNAGSPSWGTAMEIAYAFGYGKRIVAFVSEMPAESDGLDARISPWLRYHCDWIFESLSHAVEHIVSGSTAGAL